jgi:hypothetical protein
MDDLFYELDKYFPETTKKLSAYDAMLLRDEHFETESCANCSKHGFYIRDKNGKLVLGDGDFHGCTLDGMASYIDFSPSAETLKAVDALKWWFGIEDKKFGKPRSTPYDSTCGGYDGKVPYTKEGIINFIEKKNKLIKKLTGFDNETDIPDYYFKNLYESRKLNAQKLEFGNLEHIAMIKGDKKFSENLLKEEYRYVKAAV